VTVVNEKVQVENLSTLYRLPN